MAQFEKLTDDIESTPSSSPSPDTGERCADGAFAHEFHEIPTNPPVRALKLSSLPTLLFTFLLPSFLRRSSKSKPRKLHSTSYLDGLRGVAAFIVFIDHFAVNYFPLLRVGYGSTDDDWYLIQLPFIRLLYSGRASVAVFFVISGFVLSCKPLKQIHARDREGLLDTLASSVFRRGLRLYVPVAVGTFLSMLAAHWCWYDELPESSTDALPPVIESLSVQMLHWWYHMVGISWPFQDVYPNTPYGPPYNGHLWTIPIEFYGSVVVFVMLLALGRCRTGVRGLLMMFTAAATLWYERWDIFLFVAGMLMAEGSHLKMEVQDTLERLCDDDSTKLGSLKRWLTAAKFLLFVASLYLLSYPGASYPDYEPGPGIFHEWLINWTPTRYTELWFGHERFWTSLGGVMLVFSISNSKALQRIFVTNIAQFLGDISYALYIVHGPVLFTVGARLMRLLTSEGGYVGGFAVAVAANTVLCIWTADLFWRGVDVKSVAFARWSAKTCWVRDY